MIVAGREVSPSLLNLCSGSTSNLNHIKEYEVFTSTASKYIPLLLQGNLLQRRNIYENVAILPKISLMYKQDLHHYPWRMHFTELEYYLTYSNLTKFSQLKFREGGEEKFLYISFGTILDDKGDILFITTAESEYFMSNVLGGSSISFLLDDKKLYSKIKIFISSKLKDYKKVYNFLKKTFLDEYVELGCELSIMSSELIEKQIYGTEFESHVSFETIKDKENFIEFFKSTIL